MSGLCNGILKEKRCCEAEVFPAERLRTAREGRNQYEYRRQLSGKLNTLYDWMFHDAPQDNASAIDLPPTPASDVLRRFYGVFAKQKACMKGIYDIKMPEELGVEEGVMLIARERQGVCAYGIEEDTGRVIYLDHTNGVVEPLPMQAEDFLLYLIALQYTGFCPSAGQIAGGAAPVREKWGGHRMTSVCGDGAVYCFDEGVILVISGQDALVCAEKDGVMEAFERKTGWEVDYF